MRNRLVGCALALFLLSLTVQSVGFGQSLELGSEHFVVYYETSGTDAVSPDYARLVRDAFETAYEVLVDRYGFPIVDARIEVEITSGDGTELGSEYLDEEGPAGPVPVITIATSGVIAEACSSMYVPCTVEGLVRSTAAHELFHAVEDTLFLRRSNDISEAAFVEPFAVWAQEGVYPEVNDYLEDALDFLLAPDSISFFSRTYDAGMFWVFIAARHGGAAAIARVMEESVVYEGRYAIDAAFADQGLTFLDTWEEFAIAAGAGDLPDQGVIDRLVEQAPPDVKTNVRPVAARLPVLTYSGVWTGMAATIDAPNVENTSPYDLWYRDDPPGTPLRVAHAYGIDYLSLTPTSPKGMEISFSGDRETTFRADVLTLTPDGYAVHPLTEEDPVEIESPESYAGILIVVTRAEAGSGDYSITLDTLE